MVRDIQAAAERGAALARRLLASVCRQPSDRTVFDPAELVQGLIHMFRRVLGAAIKLRVDLETSTGRVFLIGPISNRR